MHRNRSTRNQFQQAVVALLISACCVKAHAHSYHPSIERSTTTQVLRSFAAFKTETAHSRFTNEDATYWTLALHGRAVATSSVSFDLLAPVHYLKLRSQAVRAGIGDLQITSRLRLLNQGQNGILIDAGIGIEIPTGDTDAGLGTGHFEFAPFVSSVVSFGAVTVHGTLGLNASLASAETEHHQKNEGEHSEHVEPHEHGPVYVNPHANLEMAYGMGATTQAVDWLLLDMTMDARTSFDEGERGNTFLVVAPKMVFVVSELWRIATHVRIPVAGRRRYEWKAGASFVLSL